VHRSGAIRPRCAVSGCLCFGFRLYNAVRLLRRYPAAGLSSFAFLTPAFGVLFGGALLGEPLSGRIFLALGLIACGIAVVSRPVRRPPV
jgi:drug/metabolite transporter (DMT)-like permease